MRDIEIANDSTKTANSFMYKNASKSIRNHNDGARRYPKIIKSIQSSRPVIDLNGLECNDYKMHLYTASLIKECAVENGFLYLANHGVSNSLVESVYNYADAFFSLSNDIKQRYYVGNQKNHRGYIPTTEKGNYKDEQGLRRYEAFDLGLDLPCDDEDFLNGNPLLGPNLWPEIPGFRETITEYLQEVIRISSLMFYAFEILLDLPKGYFKQFMTKPVSQLRLIHYIENTLSIDSNDSNMGAHTDYECFTILHSKTSGLQVLDVKNNWIDAEPIDNTFYFNIGDIMEAWSGGRFVSTIHRVKNTQDERFSIPFFAATDYYTRVRPLVSLAKHKSKYFNIRTGDHIVSQMLRDFPYLLKRYQNGEIKLDSVKPTDNPFEDRIQYT